MKKEKERRRDLLRDEVIARLSQGNFLPHTAIVGIGGYGTRIVSLIDGEKPANVKTVAINTDQKGIESASADKKIIIGRDVTDGTGAGGFSEIGYYAADLARGLIKDALKGSDGVVIVFAAGGGTGAGAGRVVAEISKELGIINIGMIMTPFAAEKERVKRAEKDIERFRALVKNTIILDNERFIRKNITLKKSMKMTAGGILKIVESMGLQISNAMMNSIAEEVQRESRVTQRSEEIEDETDLPDTPAGPKTAEALKAPMEPDIPDLDDGGNIE